MKKLIPATAVAVAALFAATGAFAQTTPPTTPATPPAKTETMPTTPMAPSARPAPAEHTQTMTEAEAKELIDANVVSSDQKNVGEVAAIQRDSSGKVIELHADVGGFLGLGETRVRVMPSQFTVVEQADQPHADRRPGQHVAEDREEVTVSRAHTRPGTASVPGCRLDDEGSAMTDTESHTPKDIRRRRQLDTQRSRLGKTWQDRSWRQKLLGQTSSVTFWTPIDDRATSRRALPSRH